MERIQESLPVERGNVSVDVQSFLNAVLLFHPIPSA